MEIHLVLSEDEAREFLVWRHASRKAVKQKLTEIAKEGKLVDWVGSNMRLRNCLINAKLFEPDQIIGKTQNDLLRYRNFGKKSFKELCCILSNHGIILDFSSNSVNPAFKWVMNQEGRS